MKESTWAECIQTSSSLKVSPNKPKTKSLVETAEDRIRYLKENIIKEDNANYIFEGYYSSVLELIQAIITLEGYKVSNHLCLGYYLRDVLKRDDLLRIFDDCRYKRNSLVYYGKKMNFETSKEAVKKCIKLFKELKILLKDKV